MQTGAVELVGRALFRFTGGDRLRYLNGQVTNNVAKAGADAAIYACITNAKGKLEADVYVRDLGDAYLVDGPAELREELGIRLERYIIADDVEMEDVTEQFVIIHVLGETGVDEEASTGVDVRWKGKVERFGVPGVDWVVAAGEFAESMRASLGGAMGFLSEQELEELRIAKGVPVWGKELGSDLLPPEARLETRAIDYKKGCYIGQEVISRIRSAGKVNRLLCGLAADSGEFQEGDLLFFKGEDGALKEVGRVTSAAGKGADRVGLGFLKRGFTEVGGRFSCGSDENSLFSSAVIREVHTPLG